jgi:salicylate hydroxylase
LATLPLGMTAAKRYGAPYLCVHRADLHRVLADNLSQMADVSIRVGRSVVELDDTEEEGVCLRVGDDPPVQGDVLVGADGLWSLTRQALLNDGEPQPTGHVAFRAMVSMADLAPALRDQNVTVWLGPHVHVVHYPVRAGESMNVVVAAQAPFSGVAQWWDNATPAFEVKNALGNTCKALPACPMNAVSTTLMRGWLGSCLSDHRWLGLTRWQGDASPCLATPLILCSPIWRKALAWL